MKVKTELVHLNSADCCGCGTCVLVCPRQAIEMVSKELGSLYPEVNQELCIGCGLCDVYCAYRQRVEALDGEPLRTFAATMTDKAKLEKSASGGVAAAASEAFIKADGVVVGCSLEPENGSLIPKHIMVRDEADLWKFRGSKYVQSTLGSSFEQIKRCLEADRRVLFIGTPCQVDSLRHFLSKTNTENLFAVDIICHGVPSAELFAGYLKTLKRQIESFSFRDKVFGWGLTASYTYRDKRGKLKKYVLSPGVSSYYTYFLDGETYRESCYTCKYASGDRVGDITIGDFWGIEQECPQLLKENGGEFNSCEGISTILVNTEKGQRLMNEYASALLLKEVEFCKVAKWNRQLTKPSSSSHMRTELGNAYSKRGYAGIEKSFREQLGLRLYVRIMKVMMKNAIRKINSWYF